MKKKILALFYLLSIGTCLLLHALPIEEDELNEEAVYAYALHDFARAKEIVRLMHERQLFPGYFINKVEGNLNYNRADYFEALKYYKRAVYDKQADDEFIMNVYEGLIGCYYHLHNLPNMEYYTNKLMELAQNAHNDIRLANALFCQGMALHQRGNWSQGYQRMEEAIELLKTQESDRVRENLYYQCMTLVEYMQQDNQNEGAWQKLRELELLLEEQKENQGYVDHTWGEVHQKDIYAHKAVLLHRRGLEEEAKAYYEKFKQTANIYQSDYVCIAPYLTDMQLYEDLIKFTEAREEYLNSISVNRNYEMVSVSRLRTLAYQGLGEYEKAACEYDRLVKLQQDIREKEEQSAADELSSVYELKEKELEMEHTTHTMRQSYTIIGGAMILCFLGFLVYRTKRHNRIIAHKNQLMAERIDELMKYKEECLMPSPTPTTSEEEHNKALYDKLVSEILSQHLYLNPNLNRDMLLERFNIPKNTFSSLFHKYGSTSYTTFINDLRLDYAVKLMKSHPQYTIESIAYESGIASATTFYRLFSQKFGMTPHEYQKAILAANDEEKA